MAVQSGKNYSITKQNAIGGVTSITKDPFFPLVIGRAYTGVKTFKVPISDTSDDDYITQTAHGLSVGDVVIYHPHSTAYKSAIIITDNDEVSKPDTGHVNTTTNSIRIPGSKHGWETGQKVMYDNQTGATLGGLTHHQTYYVIKVDDETYQVADSKKDAEYGNAENLTNGGNNDQLFFRYINDGEGFFVSIKDANSFYLHRTKAKALAAQTKIDEGESVTTDLNIHIDSLYGNDNQTFSPAIGHFDPADA